jgi:hypothetical protein
LFLTQPQYITISAILVAIFVADVAIVAVMKIHVQYFSWSFFHHCHLYDASSPVYCLMFDPLPAMITIDCCVWCTKRCKDEE